MNATKRLPLRQRRKHNIPDPLQKIEHNHIKEDDHARSQATAQLESIKRMVSRLKVAEEQDNDGGGDEREAAERTIHEDALSVEVRSGWRTIEGQKFEPEEFRILLCTGGPAVQIRGEIDQHGQPIDPILEYQDWGTPWTIYPLMEADEEALLTYAQQFYFGE